MSDIPGHEFERHLKQKLLIFVIFKTNFVTSLPTLDLLSYAQIIAKVGHWSCIHMIKQKQKNSAHNRQPALEIDIRHN